MLDRVNMGRGGGGGGELSRGTWVILPPSRLPTGKLLRAVATRPHQPPMSTGWISTLALFMALSPSTALAMLPSSRLPWNSCVGTGTRLSYNNKAARYLHFCQPLPEPGITIGMSSNRTWRYPRNVQQQNPALSWGRHPLRTRPAPVQRAQGVHSMCIRPDMLK